MAKIHRVRWKFGENLAHRKFVAERLKDLREGLQDEIHGATSEHSLRLATWNIMHFGNAGAYDRNTESMLYIAQIIDHFDLVAVQEVNRNMKKLRDLLENYLGSDWDYLVTDTSGKPTASGKKDAGNDERLAFLFRKSKVKFRQEVGEIVLPTGQEIAAPTAEGHTKKVQFARTPFSVSFQSGWLKFRLCTVHIHYGNDQSEDSHDLIHRQKEIAKIAEFLALRQDEERRDGIARARRDDWSRPLEGGWDANYILLGDFNIVSPEHKTMQALENAGFSVETRKHATNLGKKRMHYDQIAHKTANPHFKVVDSGVFNFHDYVYRDVDIDHYYKVAKTSRILFKYKNKKPTTEKRDLAAATRYYKQTYRRNQLSDHKLLWAEIAIDYSNAYLDAVIKDSQ